MPNVRKKIKRNRKPKPVRSKNWQDNSDDPDTLDALSPHTGRVMPRGERERRRAVLEMALADTASEGKAPESRPEEAGGDEIEARRKGIVVEVSSGLCRVEVDERTLMCSLRGSLSAEETGLTNVVAVGDEVLVLAGDGSGLGVVDQVLPRRTSLARPDVYRSHLLQVIVANVDQVLVIASWQAPPIWLELVDRYLIAAERQKLAPIICVNKIDLAQDEAVCRAALQPYLDLGYRVLFTSALTGQGVEDVRKLLCGRTTVLTGMSGVGKSSLLAAIQPGLELRIGQVSDSGQGRHTTTQVQMIKLEAGSFVVDTPGLCEFGLSGLRRTELAQFYPEISAAAHGCRFSDCSHSHEPGCAVKAAIEHGSVSQARYHNYQKIYQELPV
ncbi:MAG: ribosome small subunit-dependent GTPase A [Thermoflexales bacterium]|nr:ribosome small subunit-dependent GTPase A [Thermoflexales bacterium]